LEGWPEAGCVGCSFFADQISHLDHLRALDVELVLVSVAPFERLARCRERMGWQMPWHATTDELRHACDVSPAAGNSFGLSVFYRDGKTSTEPTSSRGAASRRSGPPGRSSTSPRSVVRRPGRTPREGTPREELYPWWRRRDEDEHLEGGRRAEGRLGRLGRLEREVRRLIARFERPVALAIGR
jgi:predicted dithiol-disulfide oxidoreductase (DUF899 family)